MLNKEKLNILLSCRVREVGEIMKVGDVVLINNLFFNLGFTTDYDRYFASQPVTEGMLGQVICEY